MQPNDLERSGLKNSVREQEREEQVIRELVSALPGALQYVDNYTAPKSLTMLPCIYGPVAFTGVLVVRDVKRLSAEATMTKPVLDHFLLMGVLRPHAPVATYAALARVLKSAAIRLGAPEAMELRSRTLDEKALYGGLRDGAKTSTPELITYRWQADDPGWLK